MTDLDVLRATPTWQVWVERIIMGFGYVLTRGGVIVVGALVGWSVYVYGYGVGADEGFLAGCRATTTDTACLSAEDSGNQIRKIRLSATGKALTSAQSGTIDVLCDDLRDSVSRRMAAHYGCDER